MIKKLIALLNRRREDSERGTTAVEFALATTILVPLALGAADFGSLMNTSASLRGATRAGAEYAKANWNNPLVTNPTTATEQYVCTFLGLTFSSGSCSPVNLLNVSTSCICDDGTSVTPCPPTSGNPCEASNPTNPGVLIDVTVTAQQSFSPILSWASVVLPTQVQASTTVRTQ
jgi:Flp pilus assembly protein TadG